MADPNTNPGEVTATVPANAIYQVADPTNEPMIDVFDPNGNRGQIPQSKASAAFQNQFKFATQDESGNWKPEQPVAVSMKDSNGKFSQNGFVPLSKAGQGLKAGDLQIGPTTQQKYASTQPSGIGTAGIDPFLFAAVPKIANAVKSTAHVLKIGGTTLAKIAVNPSPAGIGNALSDEYLQEQQDGGVPDSRAIVAAPFREFAGVRQPGESATLGFTGNDPSQQGILTQTTNAMSSLMGGDPASARTHYDNASTLSANGNLAEANAENQRGNADLLAVPLATAGLGRLVGSGAVGKIASGVQDAAGDAAQLTRLRALPASALSPDELLARVLNKGSKSNSGESLLDLHDATQSALPRIANAANSLGVDISNADDMLSAIRQAKTDLLTEHQNVLGPDETLNDIGPNQRAALDEDMNALNTVQKRVADLQAAENAKAAKAKTPTSKGAAINQIAQGAGKYAATRAIGNVIPLGGPVARASLNAAGITSAFSDLSSGIKGLARGGAVAAPSGLDAALAKVFSHPDLAEMFDRPEGAGAVEPPPSNVPKVIQQYMGDLSVNHETNIQPPRQPYGDAVVTPEEEYTEPEPTRAPYAPYVGDLSVQHESNIAPPRLPHGDAVLSPDYEPVPMEPTRAAYQPYSGDLSVQHETNIAPPDTPHGDARIAPASGVPPWLQAAMDTKKSTLEIPAALRDFIAPAPANDLSKNLADASPEATNLGGVGEGFDSASPSPIGRRSTPAAQQGRVTRGNATTPTPDLPPPSQFGYSRSANLDGGESAAREYLTSQTLGFLKNKAAARGIEFDSREPAATLAPKLISALTDSLSPDELDAFDTAQRSSQPNLFRRSRKGVADATVAPALTGQDLIAALQQMAEERKSSVPQPIADAMAATATDSPERSFLSGHDSVGGNASLEELSRGGGGQRHWIVDTRAGKLGTFLGTSPDAGAAGLRPGQAIVSLTRDGKLGIAANSSNLTDAQVLQKIEPVIRKEFPQRGTKPSQVPKKISELMYPQQNTVG